MPLAEFLNYLLYVVQRILTLRPMQIEKVSLLQPSPYLMTADSRGDAGVSL